MPLARGTVVGHYQGIMTRECPDDTTFVMRVDVDSDDHVYIDARDPHTSNYTRYINDPGPSCRPNCHFEQDDLRVQVVTLRAVDADEELTARYLDWHTILGDADSDDMARPKRKVSASTPRSRAKTPVKKPPTSSCSPPPSTGKLPLAYERRVFCAQPRAGSSARCRSSAPSGGRCSPMGPRGGGPGSSGCAAASPFQYTGTVPASAPGTPGADAGRPRTHSA